MGMRLGPAVATGAASAALVIALLAGWLPLPARGRDAVRTFLRRGELASGDVLVRTVGLDRAGDDRVVLAIANQADLDSISSQTGEGWPWPREYWAVLARWLADAGASVVAFDLFFTEPSRYPEDDRALGEAIAASGRVVLGAGTSSLPVDPTARTSAHDDETEAARFAMRAARVEVDGEPGSPPRRRRLVPPVEAISRRTDAIGLAEVSGDADELVRRMAPLTLVDGEPVASLAVRVVMRHLGAKALVFEDGSLRLGDRSVPLDRDGRLVLRFRRPDPPRTPGGISFPSVHVADLLAAAFRHAEGAPVAAEDRRRFEGRIVIVGVNAPGKEDVEVTPVSGTFLGPEIHATAIDGLLRGDALAPWPRGEASALLPAALVAFATALLSILPGSPVAAALAGPAAALAWAALAAIALRSGRLLPLFGPVLGASVGLAASNVWLYLTEGRQKREIGRMFSQYVSPEVVRELQAHPEKLRLGGERREMTAFFSDLEGFTTFSESMDAATLVEFLNEYLSLCTDAILDAGGVIDKYEGDAIIAFWNAPLDQPDHARRACEAALRCQEVCASFGEECSRRGWPRPRMRIGLNTGPMVVGNMGSKRHFDYTIIGDAVNLASRLEGANKAFGTRILASEATRAAGGDGLGFRPLARLRVKGRAEPVAVHELVATGPEPTWVPRFRGAIEAVERGDLAAARNGFESVLAERPDDEPSRRWLARLDGHDGRHVDPVWTLDEK